MERTIKDLAAMNGRVYVRFATQEGALRFLGMAKDEGFTFGDGAEPTQRECGEIMAVNRDNTINYVGHAGSTAFHAGAEKIGDEKLIRIDFEKYISGEAEYLYRR